MVFDKTVSPVVQLSVIESYDIMIARVERHRSGEGGKLIVFRLSDLEEFLADLLEWHHHVDQLLHRLQCFMFDYKSDTKKNTSKVIG